MLVKTPKFISKTYCQTIQTRISLCLTNYNTSQGNTVEEQTRNIHQALDGGCKWVQLRLRIIQLTQLCFGSRKKILCEEYLANFIINDNVYLAQQIADGVHLGLTDMSIKEARSI
jgi:thiamine-phosphate pyrophosphorylase